MKMDLIAERANEAHRLACALRTAGMLDELVYLPALTTESRPEGLEREIVRLVVAARRVLESSDWASNIVERRERLGALDQASEAFASRVPWDDEPDANTTPHPQTNLQENLAGSQTDAPASGEVARLRALVRGMAEHAPFVMPAQHGKAVCDDYARAVELAAATPTPSDGARDSALEEAAKVAEDYAATNDKPYSELCAMSHTQQVRYEGHKYGGQNIAAAIRALRTAKPEQAVPGLVVVPVEPTALMIGAGAPHVDNCHVGARDAYRAMLAAAPQGQNSGETSRG